MTPSARSAVPSRVCRFAAAMLWGAAAVCATAGDLRVYRNGAPSLEIRAPVDAGTDLREGLQDFWRVVRRMGGASVPVRFGGGSPGMPSLSLRVDPALRVSLEEGQGFVLEVGESGGELRAADEAGLREGLYWLLGYEAGVRWFWPGEVGEVVPSRDTWTLAEGRRVVVPAYLSRALWEVAAGAEGELWCRRNLLRDRYRHEHNLQRLFPPALATAEPALFGSNAASLNAHFWQPDLSSAAAVDHAAMTTGRHLLLHPQAEGFSLSINDSMRFDDGPGTAAQVLPLRWFRGRPDYSPLVFGFANAVARLLDAPTLAGRPLGAYAYYWAENVPPFAVEPAVLPVLTADRFQYYDPVFAANDADLMRRWGRSGARRLMLYEYLYGDAYLIPRHAPEAIARSIRNGHAAGARGYFAEARTVPGLDGPKPWMVARLLWDPSQNVRALEEDFARGMFGSEAAPTYLHWLRTAESVWMKQGGQARWLRGYHDDQQGSLLSDEDLAALGSDVRALGERVVSSSDTAHIERAAVLARAWKLTEAVVALDRSRQSVGNLAAFAWGGGAADRSAARAAASRHGALERGARALASGLQSRGELIAEPLWLASSSPVTRALSAADGWDDEPEASLGDNTNLLALRVPSDAERRRSEWFRQAVQVLPSAWGFDNRPAERLRLEPPSGDRGWRISGADAVRFAQLVPVTPGIRYRAAARVQGTVSFGVDAGLRLVFLDRARRPLGEPARVDRLEIGRHETWRRLVVDGTAPPEAVWAEVAFQVSGQAPGTAGESLPEVVEIKRLGLWYAPQSATDQR